MESAYEECLAYELVCNGLKVERQKPLPITYKDIHLDYGYRIDLLVENTVIIELKSVEAQRCSRSTDSHLSEICSKRS